MKSRRIIKHELIEIEIPASTTKTQFKIPEQNNLRNVELLGIQVHVNEITPYSPISQKPTLSQTYQKLCFLSLLNYSGFAFLHLAPSLMFQTMRYETNVIDTEAEGGTGGEPEEGGTGGDATATVTGSTVIYDTDIKDFSRQRVNWPQSYLTFSQSIAGLGTASVVLISVYYYDPATPNDNATEFREMN